MKTDVGSIPECQVTGEHCHILARGAGAMRHSHDEVIFFPFFKLKIVTHTHTQKEKEKKKTSE